MCIHRRAGVYIDSRVSIYKRRLACYDAGFFEEREEGTFSLIKWGNVYTEVYKYVSKSRRNGGFVRDLKCE